MESTRREFIKQGGTALGAAALAGPLGSVLTGCAKQPASRTFGFQSWILREKLASDFSGTLKMMAEMGYKQVEMCSPLGYVDAGFGPLNEFSGTDLRAMIEDTGLTCPSAHFNFGEMREHLDNRIEWAQQMGLTQMILSSFWLIGDEASLDNYRRCADEMNVMAEKIKAAGMQAGFHNHHMEFEKRGDELIYDVLLQEFDPDLVKMQFQVAVFNIGYIAADYFRKYPGRYISAHLADWSIEQEAAVPVGQGDVDWIDFFKAADETGVQNIFVEMAPETFKPSAEYLLSI